MQSNASAVLLLLKQNPFNPTPFDFFKPEKAPASEPGDGFVMSTAFIIEVQSHAAGIVVRDGRAYRFHAASHDFNLLDGREFRSPGEAHKAALRHLASLDKSKAGSRPVVAKAA